MLEDQRVHLPLAENVPFFEPKPNPVTIRPQIKLAWLLTPGRLITLKKGLAITPRSDRHRAVTHADQLWRG